MVIFESVALLIVRGSLKYLAENTTGLVIPDPGSTISVSPLELPRVHLQEPVGRRRLRGVLQVAEVGRRIRVDRRLRDDERRWRPRQEHDWRRWRQQRGRLLQVHPKKQGEKILLAVTWKFSTSGRCVIKISCRRINCLLQINYFFDLES